MNTFVSAKTKSIRTIKQDDTKFLISNGLVMTPRASIEIAPNCPDHCARVITEAYSNGWIKPVAHVTEHEYIFMGLSTD
jgi:hypothetical protein